MDKMQKQINQIVTCLDALDDIDIQSTEAQNAISVLSELGYVYERHETIEKCLTHGILTLSAWALMMMCVAMYFGG